MIIKRNDTHDIVTVNGFSFRFDLPEQADQLAALEADPDGFELAVSQHGEDALTVFFSAQKG